MEVDPGRIVIAAVVRDLDDDGPAAAAVRRVTAAPN